MQSYSLRLRRLATVLAAVLVFGVVVHTACQAIEHHDGAKEAVALCAAAFALIVSLRLVGGGTRGAARVLVSWLSLGELIPGESPALRLRNTAAWLQRFQN
jgi:hypothetical protein